MGFNSAFKGLMAFFSVNLDENLKQGKTLMFSTLSNSLFANNPAGRC